ncbi:MAG TPA: hypothetical protein VEJ38_15485 [Candidatus Acidoferrales bacterium]|nr:hypothetical protein [Candidatus Acidoferrales bacterium]
MKASLAAASLFSIFIVALAVPRASAQANTGAFQCIATSAEAGHATIYITAMIPGDASQRASLTSAWSAYVHAAYPQQTIQTAVCNPGSADPAIQQRVIATEMNAWQRSGMQVVQVNWQPGQAPRNGPNPKTNPYSAAEPTKDSKGDAPADKPKDEDAAAAPSGPPPRASYCYSDDKKPTVYFSDPFDTQGLPSASAWQKAFAAMLAQKYSYKGIVTCKDKATIVDVQSVILEQKDALQGKQVVDTNWSYEPPAAPAQ